MNNVCGIGDGDCDPGQCDAGVCVNDVGAEYGLPAHYDVCEARDETPDVARFNGTWSITTRYTSSGCTHHADERGTVTIANGAIRNAGRTIGSVSTSGRVSGNLYAPNGQRAGEFTGQAQERSASGTWFNLVGCSGTWTATKR
ncbi:MAG: hypothetical protein OXC18_02230 [Desulfurellaceae bacterium]|nr:hypothetical protein [Desulfurellaceae bacterium]